MIENFWFSFCFVIDLMGILFLQPIVTSNFSLYRNFYFPYCFVFSLLTLSMEIALAFINVKGEIILHMGEIFKIYFIYFFSNW